jgi:hypothetical protein
VTPTVFFPLALVAVVVGIVVARQLDRLVLRRIFGDDLLV